MTKQVYAGIMEDLSREVICSPKFKIVFELKSKPDITRDSDRIITRNSDRVSNV